MQKSEEQRGSLGCWEQLGELGAVGRVSLGEAFAEVRRTGGATGGTGGQLGAGG